MPHFELYQVILLLLGMMIAAPVAILLGYLLIIILFYTTIAAAVFSAFVLVWFGTILADAWKGVRSWCRPQPTK